MVTDTRWATVHDGMVAGYRLTPRVTAHRRGRSTVLPCTAVTVRKDADTWPRTTARLTVAAAAAPGDHDAFLGVPGPTTIRVTARVEAAGTYLDVPVASLWVTDVRGFAPENTWEVDAADGAWRVDVDTFDTPHSPTPGAIALAEVQRLITRTFPTAAFEVGNGVDLDQVVGEVTYSGSPWAVVEAHADTIGAEVWQRPDGRWMIRQPPKAGIPVAYLTTGPTGNVTQLTSAMAHVPNRVVVRFQDPTGAADFVATAQSNDPRFTPSTGYGRHTLTLDRPGPAHDWRTAQNTAEALLRRVTGGWRKAQATGIPMPWLEPGDTVQLTWPNQVVERLVVQTLDLDLSPGGTMTLTTLQSASEVVES